MHAVKIVLAAIAAAWLALVPAGAGAQGQPAAGASGLEALVIVSGGTRHAFQVEVMRTPEQRAKGLMYRNYMPADRGMLFDFAASEPVAMWMQNTYISLDMLFIRADGTIARIAERTEPLSTRTNSFRGAGALRARDQWRRQPAARHQAGRQGRARAVQALKAGVSTPAFGSRAGSPVRRFGAGGFRLRARPVA
ncbi:hypothetical protein BTHI11S_00903 [Bosea thiooxidans]